MFRSRSQPIAAALVLTAALLGSSVEAKAQDALEDGEIVAVAVALNNGEIVTSEPAQTRASSEEVRSFADRMITDHTAANEQLQMLGIALVQNALSEQLTGTAVQQASALNELEGAEFDTAYMEAQLTLHRTALETLDGTLIPQAENAELRAQLEQMRAAVAEHLALAESIHQTY